MTDSGSQPPENSLVVGGNVSHPFEPLGPIRSTIADVLSYARVGFLGSSIILLTLWIAAGSFVTYTAVNTQTANSFHGHLQPTPRISLDPHLTFSLGLLSVASTLLLTMAEMAIIGMRNPVEYVRQFMAFVTAILIATLSLTILVLFASLFIGGTNRDKASDTVDAAARAWVASHLVTKQTVPHFTGSTPEVGTYYVINTKEAARDIYKITRTATQINITQYAD